MGDTKGWYFHLLHLVNISWSRDSTKNVINILIWNWFTTLFGTCMYCILWLCCVVYVTVKLFWSVWQVSCHPSVGWTVAQCLPIRLCIHTGVIPRLLSTGEHPLASDPGTAGQHLRPDTAGWNLKSSSHTLYRKLHPHPTQLLSGSSPSLFWTSCHIPHLGPSPPLITLNKKRWREGSMWSSMANDTDLWWKIRLTSQQLMNKWKLLKYLESQYLSEKYNKVLSVKNEKQT